MEAIKMKYKIFQITGFVFEMLGLLIVLTLAIMFCVASFENISMQNEIKEFIDYLDIFEKYRNKNCPPQATVFTSRLLACFFEPAF